MDSPALFPTAIRVHQVHRRLPSTTALSIQGFCDHRAAMSTPHILSLFLLGGLAFSAAPAGRPPCTLSFDGRVPLDATAAQFSTPQSLFNPHYVIGPNVSWAEIIEFPNLPPSRVSSPPDRWRPPRPCI